MSIRIVQGRLDSYTCTTVQEEAYALREITQEIALAALSRTAFFRSAAFQGGTCLRILYGLDRFSEDLDFILKTPDPDFRMDQSLAGLSREFEAYGYKLEVQDRSKAGQPIRKAFLKDDSLGKVLTLRHLRANRSMKKIRIKLEVDTRPPPGSSFESRYHDFPFAFSLTAQDQPSLFAGKLHALLCRTYAKGRDWYDFLWYVSRKQPVNRDFLSGALHQTGPWKGKNVTADTAWTCARLQEKIRSLDWKSVREDIRRFIRPSAAKGLDVWSEDFFLDRVARFRESAAD